MTHAGTYGCYMGYAWGCRKQVGVKGDICHSHPQTSGGLSGLHFLQLGLISIHLWPLGCLGYIWHWLTILLQRNSPLFPETVTFVYHNHVVQTSLLIGKSIRFHFSRESNGVQEARWWCCLGPPPRESTDAAFFAPRYGTSSSQSFGFSVLPHSCLHGCLWETTRKHGKRVSRGILPWRRCDWLSVCLLRPALGKGRWSHQSHDQKELGKPCWTQPSRESDWTCGQGLGSPFSLSIPPFWSSCCVVVPGEGCPLDVPSPPLHSRFLHSPLGCPVPMRRGW